MLETSSIDKKIYDFFTPAKKKELENGFDAIYKQFLGKDAGVAKGFLDNLSHQELATLQHYHGLADTIDLDDLSNEGAFNLLQKAYEKKDLDGDGLFEVGAGKMLPIIPPDAPKEFKEAFYDAMVSIEQSEGKEAAFRSMMLFSMQFSKHTLNDHLKEAGFDANIPKFDFSLAGMQKYIDSKNNPQGGGYTDATVLRQLNLFFDAFKQSYENKDIPKNAESANDEMDSATRALLDDLLSKGALRFLQEFNQEKIEKLIEAKKKELEAKYSSEDLNDPAIVAQIEEELALFRKELLEKISKKDDSSEKISPYGLKDLLALQMVAPK